MKARVFLHFTPLRDQFFASGFLIDSIRRPVEIANSVEAVQDGRIHIEPVNAAFLYKHKGGAAEYKAGLDHASIWPSNLNRLICARMRLQASV